MVENCNDYIGKICFDCWLHCPAGSNFNCPKYNGYDSKSKKLQSWGLPKCAAKLAPERIIIVSLGAQGNS